MALNDRPVCDGSADGIIRRVSLVSDVEFESNPTYLSVNGHRLFLDEVHQTILLQEYEKTLIGPSSIEGTAAFESGHEGTKPSAIGQLLRVSSLPAIRGIVGLPDMHQGYCFPVGTAIAVDLDSEDAWISPEGVGFDINCGVRCITSNLEYNRGSHSIKVHGTSTEYSGDIFERVADRLDESISSGTNTSTVPISIKDLNDILDNGLGARIFGASDGIPTPNGAISHCSRIESHGRLPGNSRLISQKAKGRGISLLGTLGSGNHYLEVQYVDEVFDSDIASEYGLRTNQIVVFIHTGSRGLGHEVCNGFISQSKGAAASSSANEHPDAAHTPDSFGSSVIPFHSADGQKYFAAMNSAANYAFANRELISRLASCSIQSLIPAGRFETLYDCCHNIAKIEDINGSALLVHRKGASRAVPPQVLAASGDGFTHQPIPVGGSMATASYILASSGTEETFYSTCHGSGRLIPRARAKDHFSYEAIEAEMNSQKIVFRSQSRKGIVEEAGGCYKDIDKVVEHSERSGLTKMVVRLRPVIVIKG